MNRRQLAVVVWCLATFTLLVFIAAIMPVLEPSLAKALEEDPELESTCNGLWCPNVPWHSQPATLIAAVAAFLSLIGFAAAGLKKISNSINSEDET